MWATRVARRTSSLTDWGVVVVAKCPKCNTEVIEGTKFCPECGTKIEEALKETSCSIKIDHTIAVPSSVSKFLDSKPILHGAIAAGISWVACWLITNMFGIDKEMGIGITTYANSLAGTAVIANSGTLHASNLTFLFLTLIVATIVNRVYVMNEIQALVSFADTLKKCLLMVPWFAVASFAIAVIAKSKTAYVPPLHVLPGALIVGTIGACIGSTISHIHENGEKMLEVWTGHEDKRVTAGLLGLLAVASEITTFMAIIVIVGIILMCCIGEGTGSLIAISVMAVGNIAANIGTYAHGVSMTAQGSFLGFGGEAASISLWSWSFLGESSDKFIAWRILSWLSALIVLLATAHTAVMLEKIIRDVPIRTKSQCCLVFGGVYGVLWGYLGWLVQIGASADMASGGFGASAPALAVIAGGLAFGMIHVAIYFQKERSYTAEEANRTLIAATGLSAAIIALLFVGFIGSTDYDKPSETKSGLINSLFGSANNVEEAESHVPIQTNPLLEALGEWANEKNVEGEIGSADDDSDNRYLAPQPNADQANEDDYTTTRQEEFHQPQPAVTHRDPPPAPRQYSTPSRAPDPPSNTRRNTTPSRSTSYKPEASSIGSDESVVASNLDPTSKFSRNRLVDLPNEVLCLLRNEYYARAGCYLETPHADEFFRQFSWYKSQEKGGTKATQFRIENFPSNVRANILLIKQIEKERDSWHAKHKEGLPGVGDLAGWAHENNLSVYNDDSKIAPYYQWSMGMKSASSTNTYQCVMVLNNIDFDSGTVSGTIWQKNKSGEVTAEDVEGTLESGDGIHIRHLNLEGKSFYPQLKGWFLDKFVIDIDDNCQIQGSYFVKSNGSRAGSITGCLMEDD